MAIGLRIGRAAGVAGRVCSRFRPHIDRRQRFGSRVAAHAVVLRQYDRHRVLVRPSEAIGQPRDGRRELARATLMIDALVGGRVAARPLADQRVETQIFGLGLTSAGEVARQIGGAPAIPTRA
ncbi:hypothetical protein A8B73_13480 [Methylosinus sp. 3S-1]|nr:hypothetical protein A8B73_13480 [Methylosinus sp. 3S-1]